ncbi:hypothetical protein [Streptomyces sp. JJ36]|uniref:hypothetical protein n=1 Tax=Streptomyces sp. JJ36 TaxID=2736645 RepID=UPI001F36E4AF|nr:hypothetical protein [Streptomyces sp. JJ36]MCF6522324.1 hypothetical protein [Streptomyces sp. JJ36]
MGRAGRVAADVGVGLAAGLAGTLAMTVSSTVEMKVRGRGGSSSPADAAGKLLGVRPADEEGEQRFSQAVHYGYGTAWGAARGLLASLGLGPAAASAAHLGLVWGSEQVMLPALDVSPPATQWGAREVAVDALHHVVYAAATGAAYTLLDRNR